MSVIRRNLGDLLNTRADAARVRHMRLKTLAHEIMIAWLNTGSQQSWSVR